MCLYRHKNLWQGEIHNEHIRRVCWFKFPASEHLQRWEVNLLQTSEMRALAMQIVAATLDDQSQDLFNRSFKHAICVVPAYDISQMAAMTFDKPWNISIIILRKESSYWRSKWWSVLFIITITMHMNKS